MMGLFDRMAGKMMRGAMESAMEAAEAFTGAMGHEEITDGIDGVGVVAEVPVIGSTAQTYVQPLSLVIELPGHEPYAARPVTAFPREKIPTKGQRLPVRVSAADPMRIVVMWDRVARGLEAELAAARGATGTSAGATTGDVIAELERLNALRASGALSAQEFAALKARLLGGK